jgi:HEAT repeat protein
MDEWIKILNEDDWGLRRFAVERLRAYNDPRAIPYIEEAFNSEVDLRTQYFMKRAIDKMKLSEEKLKNKK